jgi:phosphatidylserine/phosphatidylglycerophosphate/cardiolipin synthase-like enzyme
MPAALRAHPLADLSVLDGFKTGGFAAGYPPDARTFYSPVDDLHGALAYAVKIAKKELIVAMFGFDDPILAAALKGKLADPNVFVQLTLDKTQAAGAHEAALLTQEDYPKSSIAVGSSEHGRIMHLKVIVIDGLWLVSGSTNWSDAAESLQDNELTIRYSPVEANEARIRIAHIHANILQQGEL